jgi:hypothetical protein
MLNTTKEVWFNLRPLGDDGKKVSHAVCAPQTQGKVYLFMLDPRGKQAYPEMRIYDIRKMSHKLDPYWQALHREEKKAKVKNQHVINLFGKNRDLSERS